MVRKKLQPRVLLDGLAMVESPRWHDDRLWFPHWGTDEIIAADLDGNVEVVAHGVSGMGQSIGWLPDGRMLETGFELMRFEPDGSRVRHVDLTHISPYIWSEMTVDGRGNIYVNSIGFDFAEMGQRVQNAAESTVGVIALITPDGVATQVAGAIAFPNGMVITPDNQTLIVSESFTGTLLAFDIDHDGRLTNRRAWAEGLGPDGICMDADGAIWTSPAQPDIGVVRVGRGRRGTRRDRTRHRLLRHRPGWSRRSNPVHDVQRLQGPRQLRRDDRVAHSKGPNRGCAGPDGGLALSQWPLFRCHRLFNGSRPTQPRGRGGCEQ